MFKIWVDTFSREMKEIKNEVKQTNDLLRDEVSTTKAILTQHIVEYNKSTTDNEKKFDKIFAVLRSREGVYKAAKFVKWGLSLFIAGLLTAAGASIWSGYSIEEKPKIETVK